MLRKDLLNEQFHHLEIQFQNFLYHLTCLQILPLLLWLPGFLFCYSAEPYHITTHQCIEISTNFILFNQVTPILSFN